MSERLPPSDQRDYWNRAAGAKVFAHPFRPERFADVPRDAPVLDLGCGYGRVAAELDSSGWRSVVAADSSAAMVRLARERAPHARHVVAGAPLPFADGRFGGALLFAVLTCLPDPAAQRDLVAELRRVVRPGGLVYASDLLRQGDARHARRYAAGERRFGVRGAFELDDGAVMRHHERAELEALFDASAGFELCTFEELEVRTMNGHAARGAQLVARVRA
jgi:SAM-dependent methyltransferase